VPKDAGLNDTLANPMPRESKEVLRRGSGM